MRAKIDELYGGKVRVRACGMCWQGNALVLVNHRGLGSPDFWSPPGGGIEFGETAEATVIREFKEETGLEVAVENFLFACEYIDLPLHAVELFFQVTLIGGTLGTGNDPEMNANEQIIQDVRFWSYPALQNMEEHAKHAVLNHFNDAEKLKSAVGYIKI